MEDVSLYAMNVDSKTVDRLTDFNDLTILLGVSRSNWKSSIAFHDSIIYYKVSPVMEWDWYYKNSRNRMDSGKIDLLKNN